MEKCDYCGKPNPAQGFWIGAKLNTESGFTLVEGPGKMACDDCYPAVARHTEKRTQKEVTR